MAPGRRQMLALLAALASGGCTTASNGGDGGPDPTPTDTPATLDVEPADVWPREDAFEAGWQFETDGDTKHYYDLETESVTIVTVEVADSTTTARTAYREERDELTANRSSDPVDYGSAGILVKRHADEAIILFRDRNVVVHILVYRDQYAIEPDPVERARWFAEQMVERLSS